MYGEIAGDGGVVADLTLSPDIREQFVEEPLGVFRTGLGLRVWGLGYRVQGSGFRVEG